MKTVTIALSLAVTSLTHGATLTVNNSGFPAQYTSLGAAINAATNGDTILVAASQFSYGDVVLAKPLYIHGEVAWPTSGNAARIGYLDINPGSEGARITGLRIEASGASVRLNCSDVTIERCRIVGEMIVDGPCSNFNLLNCYLIDSTTLLDINYNLSYSSFHNNIFNNTATGSNFNLIEESNQAGISFRNNLVMMDTNSSSSFLIGPNVDNLLFENNIFWGSRATAHPSATNNWYNNNLSFGNSHPLPPANNPGSGNLVGVNPLFTAAPDRAATNAYDYGLQSGSPGENAGSDGTDIGIHGGTYPWPNYFGYPDMPRVTSIILQENTIPEGSNVNTTVEGTKVD